MAFLNALLVPLRIWNDTVLTVGRWISIVAIALMVIAILVQVFFRYALNNALPWPEEAARFMMLWMTGLMAPMAYRQGGFVAIDLVVDLLPRHLGRMLALFLLVISGLVLAAAVPIGLTELTGFNAKFATASLFLPANLEFTEWLRVPRWWMMLSLFVCVVQLLIVNIELILKTLVEILGSEPEQPDPAAAQVTGE